MRTLREIQIFLKTFTTKYRNTSFLLTFIFVFVSLVNIYGYLRSHNRVKPVVWIHSRKMTAGAMKDVVSVFKKFGYKIETTKPLSWDVLWAQPYPFISLNKHISKLKDNQQVNHFPGTSYITSKEYLIATKSKYIPTSFSLPLNLPEFLQYSKDHPEMLWVKKSTNKDDIQVDKVQGMYLSSEEAIIQQYIADPYLIDGKRFDVGVYATITSFDPLLVYINEHDFSVRLCKKDYYPFDNKDKEKFVIDEKYLPLSKAPSLKIFSENLRYNQREALFAYMQKQGNNTSQLMGKIRDCIRDVFLKIQDNIRAEFQGHGFQKGNFFEMVRFDFVVGKEMDVHLQEVNMSPELSSVAYPLNKDLYQSTLTGLFHLVGLDSLPSDRGTAVVPDEEIFPSHKACASRRCLKNCSILECKLCKECLGTAERVAELKKAYFQHQNRGGWRRVLPKPFKNQSQAKDWGHISDEHFKSLSDPDQLFALWFHWKCVKDSRWCT